jgi:hypothetical protein
VRGEEKLNPVVILCLPKVGKITKKMDGSVVVPDTFAYPDDVEGASMEAEIYHGGAAEAGEYVEETDAERIARGDLRWSDARTSFTTELPSMLGDVDFITALQEYTITQRTLNRLVAAFVFSVVGEWSSFITYVVYVFFSKNVFDTENDGSDLSQAMYTVMTSVLLAGQLTFYFARILTAILFGVMAMITLYICIVKRKAYRFNPVKQ